MAVANGDRWDQVRRASMIKKHKQRQNEIRGGHSCLETHTHKDEGEMWADLPPSQQGQCEVFI